MTDRVDKIATEEGYKWTFTEELEYKK